MFYAKDVTSGRSYLVLPEKPTEGIEGLALPEKPGLGL